MQFRSFAVSFFAAVAVAQSNSTSLADLVSQLPTCALSCLNSGASSVNCAVTDFTCLCNAGQSFISSAGLCVLTSSCSSEEKNNVTTLANEICSDVSSGASSSDLASASAVATSIIGTAAAASPTSTTGSSGAAATPMVAIGMMGGAAALAAFAF